MDSKQKASLLSSKGENHAITTQTSQGSNFKKNLPLKKRDTLFYFLNLVIEDFIPWRESAKAAPLKLKYRNVLSPDGSLRKQDPKWSICFSLCFTYIGYKKDTWLHFARGCKKSTCYILGFLFFFFFFKNPDF